MAKQALSPEEAAAAALKASQRAASSYQTQLVPVCGSVAAYLSEVIWQVVWPGRPGAVAHDAINQGLPDELIKLLAAPETEVLMQAGFCAAGSIDYMALQGGAKSGTSMRGVYHQQKAMPLCNEPRHMELINVLGLGGALPALCTPIGAVTNPDAPQMCVALVCCKAAQEALGATECPAGTISSSASSVDVSCALLMALAESVKTATHSMGGVAACTHHVTLMSALVHSAGEPRGASGVACMHAVAAILKLLTATYLCAHALAMQFRTLAATAFPARWRGLCWPT